MATRIKQMDWRCGPNMEEQYRQAKRRQERHAEMVMTTWRERQKNDKKA